MKNSEMTISSQVTDELEEAEGLIYKTNSLISHCQSLLLQKGVDQKLIPLEHWLESYCQNLATLHIILGNGMEFLKEIQTRIKLALDELMRWEMEGGTPATGKEQASQINDLNRSLRKIDLLIGALEKIAFQKELKLTDA